MSEDKQVILCADCGCVIEDDDNSYTLRNGSTVCEDCIDNYAYCAECEEYVDEADGEEVNGKFVCYDCLENDRRYFKCVECGGWFRETAWNKYTIWNGDAICDSCYENSYSTCETCGEVYPYDDMVEDDDCWFCPDCARSRKKRAIHDYGYKPSPKFKTMAHDEFATSQDIRELLFGVELEIDKGDDPEDTAEAICGLSEDVYCKHDGSLSNGVEIVTHPCTLEYHTKKLGWDEICRIAKDNSFVSQNAGTCGLHIHVGRYQLGGSDEERGDTAAKAILLMDRFWDAMVKFSRRKEQRLNQWAGKPDVDIYSGITENGARKEALSTRRNGRYQAINLENESTIEFRLYNGTLKADTIIASLQMTSNFCTYAKTHTIAEVLSSKWKDVCEVEEFSELNKYLAARELTEIDDPKPIELSPVKEQGFKVGDRVRIVSADDYMGIGATALRTRIGVTAEVAIVEDWEGGGKYGIVFDEASGSLHTLNGKISECRGYWVAAGNIEKI